MDPEDNLTESEISDNGSNISNGDNVSAYIRQAIARNNRSAQASENWYCTLPIYPNSDDFERSFLIRMPTLQN